jgi:hypothetical protein
MRHLYLTTTGKPDTLALCNEDGEIIHSQFRTVIDSKCGNICEVHVSFYYDPADKYDVSRGFLKPYKKPPGPLDKQIEELKELALDAAKPAINPIVEALRKIIERLKR